MLRRNSLRTGMIGAMAWALAVLASVDAAHAAPPVITYTDLYTLGMPAGFNSITPFGFQIAAGGQVVGYGSGSATGNNDHALLWSPSATSGVDLNPAGFTQSRAQGTDGTQQVGNRNFGDSALLWNGSADSVVGLGPSGFSHSLATGTSGTQQVGYGSGANTTGNDLHALLWSGSAASAVDLNPSGFLDSSAVGTNGTQQVGRGYGPATGNDYHALLWNGTAASAVDLNPSGFAFSEAWGTSAAQQVGEGYVVLSEIHALLWNGSAASFVDLNPYGFTTSTAKGTNGTQQVGYGVNAGTGGNHALLWSGSAESYVDLGALLPDTFTESYAYSIDGGSIYGLAIDTSGNYHAIEWSIVPEPGSIGLVGLAMLACMGTRRKRKRR